MGGDGHGHHVYKVPDYRIYKVEDIPKLKLVQDRLAERGLKDPWLRNYVWRYDPNPPSTISIIFKSVFRGWKVAIPAFIITIGFEHFFLKDSHDHEHH